MRRTSAPTCHVRFAPARRGIAGEARKPVVQVRQAIAACPLRAKTI
jgi:hypothetical protein